MWRLAESLKKLREQINAAYPNRDKASDGSIGNAEHAARTSDHNPWVKDKNGVGVVTAIDIDEDLAGNLHSIEGVVSAIRASRDPRVKYIIYERRITVKGTNLQQWKPYVGKNPHDHHAHISVNSEAGLYDDRSDWAIAGATTPVQPVSAPVPVKLRDLEIGDVGEDVKALQTKLGVTADGEFGRATKQAVIAFQQKHKLTADGIVGPKTRALL